MTRITPPVVTASVGSRTVTIDTGELLFPALVLAFCLFYYWDTRNLPDLSMLYAGPLLYATAVLAVVTIFGQAVSFDDPIDERESDLERSSDGPPPELASAETSSEIRETRAETRETSFETPSDESFFTVRNAVLLVGLTTAYIVALDRLGFLVTTIGFLALTLSLFGERDPAKIALYSIGVAFVVWLVFVQWLMVPL